MDRSGDEAPTPRPGSPEPEVSLADAGIAAEIAHAAARGRGADRAPTLEQLLAAFGEREPTDAARRRVAAALRVAGMGSRPGVLEAEPGQRLMLLPPGSGSGARRGRAAAGVLALVAIVAMTAVAAGALGGSDGDRASDSLPAETTLASIGGTTGTTATAADTTATATAETDTTATNGTEPGAAPGATTPTTTTEDDAAAEQAAAERRRKARARARHEREARRKRAAAASRRQTVAVVVDASAQPTFLCVDDGDGKQLYNGTLSGRETFRAKHVRLNIGLASTVVTVHGTRIPLSGSPAGLDISKQSGAQELPLGQRPCG